MKHFAPLLAAAPLLALAACGGASNPATKTKPVYCPSVAVLEQGNSLTQYLPGRNDVAAQITTASITGVAGDCDVKGDHAPLRLNFKVGFSASNGPADHGRPVSLPYFVAITQGDKIISKQPYSITLKFDGNASTASAVSKSIELQFPNDPSNLNYQVLVSFQR
ncbi:MAG TPA: hypothetical protein PLT25_12700 [Acidocella sp.]|nr:hypothetical protein [Acidocella sp.]HQU05561.1 hypothetical protein [Acidocella sp.]